MYPSDARSFQRRGEVTPPFPPPPPPPFRALLLLGEEDREGEGEWGGDTVIPPPPPPLPTLLLGGLAVGLSCWYWEWGEEGGGCTLRERAEEAMVGAAAPKRALRRGGTKGPTWPPVGLRRVGELEPLGEEEEAEWGLLAVGIRGAGEPLSTFTALAAPTATAATGDESTDTVPPPFTGVVEEDPSVAAGKKDWTVSMPPPPVEISSPTP